MMKNSKNEEKVVSEIQATSEQAFFSPIANTAISVEQPDTPFLQAQMSPAQAAMVQYQVFADIGQKSLNDRDSANNQNDDSDRMHANQISDFVDEEEDDAANKRCIIENLHNIVDETSISAELSKQVRSNNTGLGGGQFAMQVSKNAPLYQSFLSQQEKPMSQQSSLAKNFTQRRVSEHEANLIGSQQSNWPSALAIEQDNYVDVVFDSSCSQSKQTSNVREGSGQNLSDDVLCQPQVTTTSLSHNTDQRLSQGTSMSHNEHNQVSPDSKEDQHRAAAEFSAADQSSSVLHHQNELTNSSRSTSRLQQQQQSYDPNNIYCSNSESAMFLKNSSQQQQTQLAPRPPPSFQGATAQSSQLANHLSQYPQSFANNNNSQHMAQPNFYDQYTDQGFYDGYSGGVAATRARAGSNNDLIQQNQHQNHQQHSNTSQYHNNSKIAHFSQMNHSKVNNALQARNYAFDHNVAAKQLYLQPHHDTNNQINSSSDHQSQLQQANQFAQAAFQSTTMQTTVGGPNHYFAQNAHSPHITVENSNLASITVTGNHDTTSGFDPAASYHHNQSSNNSIFPPAASNVSGSATAQSSGSPDIANLNLNMYQTPRHSTITSKAFEVEGRTQSSCQQISAMSTFENTPQIAQFSANGKSNHHQYLISNHLSSPGDNNEISGGPHLTDGSQQFHPFVQQLSEQSGLIIQTHLQNNSIQTPKSTTPQHQQIGQSQSSVVNDQSQKQSPKQPQTPTGHQLSEGQHQAPPHLMQQQLHQGGSSPMNARFAFLQTIDSSATPSSPAKFHPTTPQTTGSIQQYQQELQQHHQSNHLFQLSTMPPQFSPQEHFQHQISNANNLSQPRFMFSHHQHQQPAHYAPHNQSQMQQQQVQHQQHFTNTSPEMQQQQYQQQQLQQHSSMMHQLSLNQQSQFTTAAGITNHNYHQFGGNSAASNTQTASMLQLQQNLADLQINTANFHGGNVPHQHQQHHHLMESQVAAAADFHHHQHQHQNGGNYSSQRGSGGSSLLPQVLQSSSHPNGSSSSIAKDSGSSGNMRITKEDIMQQIFGYQQSKSGNNPQQNSNNLHHQNQPHPHQQSSKHYQQSHQQFNQLSQSQRQQLGGKNTGGIHHTAGSGSGGVNATQASQTNASGGQNNNHQHNKNAANNGNGNHNHHHHQQRAQQKNQLFSSSKSEAANSNKSGFSGMIVNSYGGSGAGSQKTQTTAISNNTTEGGNGTTNATAGSGGGQEHHLQLLIEKMQNLPANASWTEKQSILSGNITRLVTTQTGSKYLQNSQLTKSNPVLIEFLLTEIGDQLSPIMRNQYGNYFFQKLLSNCSVSQRLQILRMIQDDFIKICCHKQGTHTIQAILDNVTTEEEENFIKKALQGHIYELSIDEQGTHVIRKVLQCRSFDQDKQSFIFQKIYDDLNQLCKNKQGLCVIKIIIALTKTAEMKKRVIQQILQDLIELVSDPYGNYAVSTIVEKWEPKICQPIFIKLANKISELSIQKYSSCVIEKCLESRDRETRSIFIREISGSPRLFALVSHNYGNFVIQKALKLAQGQDKEQLVQAIERCTPQIQDKKIRAKWQEIIENSSGDCFVIEQRNYVDYPYSNSPEQQDQQLHSMALQLDPYQEQHVQVHLDQYEPSAMGSGTEQHMAAAEASVHHQHQHHQQHQHHGGERYEYRAKAANSTNQQHNNNNNSRQNHSNQMSSGQKRGGFGKRNSNAHQHHQQAAQQQFQHQSQQNYASGAGSRAQGGAVQRDNIDSQSSSAHGSSQTSNSQRGYNSQRSYGSKGGKKHSNQHLNQQNHQASAAASGGANNNSVHQSSSAASAGGNAAGRSGKYNETINKC